MKLIILGSNGFLPSEDRQTACYMIPEMGIILDAGSGLFRMSRYLQTSSLSVFLTHSHSDHTLGLHYLHGAILSKEFAESKEQISDENVGPQFQRQKEFLKKVTVRAASPTLTNVRKEFFFLKPAPWAELETEEKLPGDGRLYHFPVDHTTDCFGFRLDWTGHSLAYVTDTIANPNAAYVKRIEKVDVLLHDCYMPNRLAKAAEMTGHGHTAGAAQVAAQAQVGRLILIHHNPLLPLISAAELNSARQLFPYVEVGLDGMEIEF